MKKVKVNVSFNGREINAIGSLQNFSLIVEVPEFATDQKVQLLMYEKYEHITNFAMYHNDWLNIDMKTSDIEKSIVDPYTFKDLFLELNCNLPKDKTNKATVRKHFQTVLAANIESANEVFEMNINAIVKHAKT